MHYSVFRRTAIPATLAVLLLTAAACSPSKANRATSGATVPSAPATTTTTNPYAIPAVIDAAYVNRVLAGLDAAIGDVVRLIVRSKTIPPEAIDRLKAIYAEPKLLQLSIDSFQSDMRKGFNNYKPSPGNEVTNVVQLITIRPNCIFARVTRDYSPVGNNVSAAAGTEWIGLVPVGPAGDLSHYNDTYWAFVYEGFPPDRTQPPDPCVR